MPGLNTYQTNTYAVYSWWRHQMETFYAILPLCEGNPPVTGEFPPQRPVTRSFDVFFDLRMKKCWANIQYASDLGHHRAPTQKVYLH